MHLLHCWHPGDSYVKVTPKPFGPDHTWTMRNGVCCECGKIKAWLASDWLGSY